MMRNVSLESLGDKIRCWTLTVVLSFILREEKKKMDKCKYSPERLDVEGGLVAVPPQQKE